MGRREAGRENGLTFPKLGNFRRGDPFSLALWLKMPAKSPRAVVLVIIPKRRLTLAAEGMKSYLKMGTWRLACTTCGQRIRSKYAVRSRYRWTSGSI